ncbi:MAG TPA: chemotaxis protein CheB [Candidatus Acidoferrales bacterium]|nr:chemotaxis protein CheB [Candidatus Acidoferrales bacterium]
MCPIVGIGASAGGLDAFKKFFSALPAESGMAFVLIQHLDPTRESLTAELVGTYTRMRVVQAEDGMRVEANRVYVIPPNAYLSIHDRTLRLSAPSAPRSLRMAVDFFLHSLAEDQQEHAIGIILSGTGTDGTLGLKEVKAGGGMTMVQDPHTVQHDGMPRSAIASGSADYVLPAEEMADALLAYVQHAAVAATRMAALSEKAPDPLSTAMEVLHACTKFDFSGYKKGTLRRRMQRRMSLRHLTDLPKYVEVLRNDPAEVTALFKDLLINVTSFFREPAAWQVLQEHVIRPVVAAKHTDVPLRVWIPACATGEEAYSIAMVLIEEIQAAGKSCRLQVFASDVDAEALERARAGIYPEGIGAHVSPQRLSRFFIKKEHSYQVNKELRDTVVFAQQSLVSDPPFSRLDVISCRNLFIYLEPAVQERLIPLLHFALLEGGYLFLGSAEGIGLHEDLFEPVSAKWRIYRRVGPTRHDRLQFPVAVAPVSTAARGRTPRLPNPARLAALAQSLLLQRYAPASVIVNRTGEILYFHGRTDDYLMQPAGTPTRDLFAQARSGLRSKLRSALQDAVRGNQRVVLPGIQMRRGSAFPRVKITVEPLTATTTESAGLWLVSLEDEPEIAPATPSADRSTAVDAALVQQLEYELKSTKEDLEQTIEDLRAANEELMSVNEEFQSSNEELETSKEELQSLNEELTTANTQLEHKIGELEASNNDLDNLLTSTNIATLFLDTHLCIRRFTPAATRLFSLIPSDIGRAIGDIAPKFADPDLLPDAAAVLQQPIAPKTEVQAHDGRWYVRQVLPYRTRDKRTEGVVMTFSDVAAEALQEARLYAESIVDTVREPLLVLDADLRVRSANQSFYATFQVSQEDTVGQLLYELGNGQWDIPTLRALLAEVLPQKRALNDFDLEANFESIGPRIMQLNARAIDRGADRPYLILLAIEDITERQQAQEALRESEDRKHLEEQVRQRQAELAHALRISTVGELATGLAHELNQPLSAIANGVEACARYVRSGKAESEKLLALLDEASEEAVRAGSIVQHLRHFIEKGQPQFEPTDLREIARNVPRLLGREIQEGHITLRLDVPPQPLPIHADRIQIEQIIVNLMQNAIDALREAPSARQEIQLQVWAAKGMAEVAVRDTGTGVSAATTERMFEPFFTTKPHGLGMGLAISRSIIEAHRGRIWVKRRADGGPGTTVRFTLPLLQAPRAARKKRAT